MAIQKIGFTQEQLRWGAILGTIAHAVWVAQQPLLAAAQSWSGRNYLLDNTSGTLGAATFRDHDLFVALFDAKSGRSPFSSEGQQYSFEPYLAGIPDDLRSLALNETFEFMLQEYNDVTMPIITAAFWSDGDDLVAVEPWTELRENGGHILRIQLMEKERALAEWQNEFEFSSQQIDLVRALYERKRANPDVRFSLAEAERHALAPGSGEAECREILKSIGIDL